MSTKVAPINAEDTAPVTSDDTTPADDTVDPVAGHPLHPILGGDEQAAARAPESPNSQRRGVPCKGGDGVLNGSENDQARVAKLWVMCIVLPKESADDEDVPIESKISLLSKCLPAVAADRARRVEFKKLIRQAVLDAEAEDGAVLAGQGAGSSNEHYLSKLSCAHRVLRNRTSPTAQANRTETRRQGNVRPRCLCVGQDLANCVTEFYCGHVAFRMQHRHEDRRHSIPGNVLSVLTTYLHN
jgi:hypothetical protein